jgi:transposase
VRREPAMKKSERQTKAAAREDWAHYRADAAGVDIGAEEIWACAPPERAEQPVRRFGTVTPDLHALAEWLAECGVKTVAMESTGV